VVARDGRIRNRNGRRVLPRGRAMRSSYAIPGVGLRSLDVYRPEGSGVEASRSTAARAASRVLHAAGRSQRKAWKKPSAVSLTPTTFRRSPPWLG
jgi:hypothetical protein